MLEDQERSFRSIDLFQVHRNVLCLLTTFEQKNSGLSPINRKDFWVFITYRTKIITEKRKELGEDAKIRRAIVLVRGPQPAKATKSIGAEYRDETTMGLIWGPAHEAHFTSQQLFLWDFGLQDQAQPASTAQLVDTLPTF